MAEGIKPRYNDDLDANKVVSIDYTNYRGERAWRQVSPIGLVYEENKFHPKPQWLLYALEKRDGEVITRAFAVKDIHEWKEPN